MKGAISDKHCMSAKPDTSAEVSERSQVGPILEAPRETRLPVRGDSVRAARLAVKAALGDWGLFDLRCPNDDGTILADTVVECVSELVTNALNHPKHPSWADIPIQDRFIGIRISVVAGWLLIEVEDCDQNRPLAPMPPIINAGAIEKTAESGMGLWTVEQLVSLWYGSLGSWEVPLGKAVWIEIPVFKAAIAESLAGTSPRANALLTTERVKMSTSQVPTDTAPSC